MDFLISGFPNFLKTTKLLKKLNGMVVLNNSQLLKLKTRISSLSDYL